MFYFFTVVMWAAGCFNAFSLVSLWVLFYLSSPFTEWPRLPHKVRVWKARVFKGRL